ncbi:MAG: coproporphyrinogen dehydrogenase HemZ [Clostridia bacterium]|nr:coproporphyrinogen dehydrogenase HemZ [Clostridia bacterium]
MLNTNRIDYKKDLEEVIFMFDGGANLDITHNQVTEGNLFYDEFVLNGEKFTFKNEKNCENLIVLKRFEKRFSKLGLYKILTNYFGENLPWGALTGIRPVKMATTLGANFENEFKKVFEVTDKKIQIVKDIVNVQKNIVDYNGDYEDFFVGIPFCPSRCAYCSFVSEEIGRSKNADEYVNALVTEIENTLPLVKNVRSIYVGGGTPVSISNENLEKILTSLSPLVKSAKEFTVEAGRPDCINEEKLSLLKKYGVTRICVNPQTFHDKTLKLIGRNHTVSEIYEKFALCKKFGFIINTDLIAGLPNEDFFDFKFSVDTAISLGAENITVHTLCLKKGSKLKEQVERLKISKINEMVDYAYDVLTKNGYNPYYLYRQKYTAGNLENVGYAKKGYECLYNANVMEEYSNNIACGANAVSKRVFNLEDRIERYGAPKDIKTYINKVPEIIKNKQELYK